MSIVEALTAQAFALTGSVARRLSSALPERFHAGKRACRALQNLRDAPSGPYFARAVLESRLRSALLLRYVAYLSRPRIREFLEHRVTFEGAIGANRALEGSRPVILAAPHYGAAPIGFIAAVQRMQRRGTINLFFDTSRPVPRLNLLFERSGVDTGTLLGGFAGVMAALRALGRGESLVIMPDAFDDMTYTLAVPFFGRMLRAAAGTAFLALRTGAWVVPVFAAPARQLGVHVTIGRPLDPHRMTAFEESQAIFMLTRALFASFERQMRRTPEHWYNWEAFPRVSTAVEAPGRLEDDAPLRLLRTKCAAAPHLLADLPELELLVQ